MPGRVKGPPLSAATTDPRPPGDAPSAATCADALPGYAVAYFDALASTSTTAVACDLPRPFVVVARNQTAGRGRRGRTWLAGGGLTATFAFDTLRLDAGHLSLVAAVLVRRALARFRPDVRLKWPNDLLLPTPGGEGKVAGLLVERLGGRDLIGVGVNVTSHPHATGEGGLAAAALGVASRVDVLAAVGAALAALPRVASFADVADEYVRHHAWQGRRVLVTCRTSAWCGRVEGVSPSGALVVAGVPVTDATVRALD